jgi:uncharacterized repeat protein (TIGR03803 family)
VVLYSFTGQSGSGTDGFGPVGGLAMGRAAPGTTYGTIFYGVTRGGGRNQSGTLFSIGPNAMPGTTLAQYSQLHSFGDPSFGRDGTAPGAGLLLVGTTLYGTTSLGGTHNQGTIFSYDPTLAANNYTVLYSFRGGTDGAAPMAALINANGLLYGTTARGGGAGCFDHGGCGTVFAFNPATGADTVLHAFVGGTADGAAPMGNVTYYNGVLYGTASAGGSALCFAAAGCGTVFQIDLASGAYRQLHAFRSGGRDGAVPLDGLSVLTLSVGTVLVGDTSKGGGGTCSLDGCGTLFALNPTTLVERQLYATGTGMVGAAGLPLASHRGAMPAAPVGNLTPLGLGGAGVDASHRGVMGSTASGGGAAALSAARAAAAQAGCHTNFAHSAGTIYQLVIEPVTPTPFTVVYSFTGLSDGALPVGGLVQPGQTGPYYGETAQGGVCESGTVFQIQP